jgi:general bacterial porin, GBP family
MKKLLIATAAMAVVAGAQAQSSVTVYGNIDLNYVSSEVNKAGANTALGDNALTTSILGFKGTEDLGGGLKAEFQLESKLTPSTGLAGAGSTTTASSELFNREAWVGFNSAKFGAIRIGTSDVTTAQGIDGKVGQMGNLSDNTADIGTDKNKTVRYTTPTFSGVTAQVGYSNEGATVSSTNIATETTGSLATGSITSAYIQYEAGALGLYAGQSEYKKASGYEQKQTAFGAKYDFGVAAVGVSYSTVDANTQSTNELKQTRVSLSAPVSALGSGVKFHAVYFKDATDNDDTIQVGTNTDATAATNGYKVGLSKAFSKRTSAYVAYVDQNDSKTGQTTNDAKVYAVGVQHSF